jgi:hypothetical protein
MTTAPADLEIGVPIRTGLFGGGIKMRPIFLQRKIAGCRRRGKTTL